MISATLQKAINNHHHIAGWLTVNEGKKLYQLALEKSGQTIVEIGSWKGKSTIYLGLGALASSSLVYAVDPHLGFWDQPKNTQVKPTFKEFKKNITHAGIHKAVIPLVTTSKNAVSIWREPIDLLFIDGLHDFPNSSFDFLHWTKHLKDGGYVILHDAFCGQEGPMQVAQELLFTSPKFNNIRVRGSMIYAHNGGKAPSIDTFRKKLIRMSHQIYNSHLPNICKILLIHKFLKIFLI